MISYVCCNIMLTNHGLIRFNIISLASDSSAPVVVPHPRCRLYHLRRQALRAAAVNLHRHAPLKTVGQEQLRRGGGAVAGNA
jgi:hypothetical protein